MRLRIQENSSGGPVSVGGGMEAARLAVSCPSRVKAEEETYPAEDGCSSVPLLSISNYHLL